MNNLLTLLGLILVGVVGWWGVNNVVYPCRAPLTYSLGSFDAKFGITREQFIDSLKKAEVVWEKPLGKNLLEYQEEGELKIHLTYDDRQAATEQLEALGLSVSADKEAYATAARAYNEAKESYEANKQIVAKAIAAFELKQDKYETEVKQWNREGGAPKDVVARLEVERLALNKEAERLNDLQTNLQQEVAVVNDWVKTLNNLAKSLNLTVAQFNQIGEERGEEFEEGIYRQARGEASITIFEFQNEAKLVRLLAHEFGHALGLDHVDDPKAIMYRLNEGESTIAMAADVAAIKDRCRLSD